MLELRYVLGRPQLGIQPILLSSKIVRPLSYTKGIGLKQISPILSRLSSRRYVTRTNSNCNSGVKSKESTIDPKLNKEYPGFKKIFLLGIIGTVIFVEAVRSLDRNKPKTYSNEEFDNVMSGLRRKTTMFNEGDLDIQFFLSNDTKEVEKLKNQYGGSVIILNPLDVAEYYRMNPNDQYEPLLNEIYDQFKDESYIEHLPLGMLVMLIGRYMNDGFKLGNNHSKIIIVNFPKDIKDAIKFENEIAVVSKILIPKDSELINTDICKYYEGVDKVEKI
ncbi:Aim36p NDAI_0H03140 [Naumovozyma dairenensis CBS 421]|uniref:Altered inheritance of mitochondria protein 36, mitochondrial n=1 Tax=Naumovozyma dairenensis (strain ATCC 10597 / BCRC 20456 / CBS 421 / NBRC 0211 / NRRL Y-12639) TaxID=1071378 RepID=G0WFC6_NAUDC|nr:hypothetical protein NDAI_0H03140 [Naumovozyma dairenensis CBS 421]CCD26487.1 hypothetical protein NDAI_0H03140 [Naumovozyma dairenensis CBS 421]